MIAYRELIDLETNLIRIASVHKTMAAVAAGIATIPSEDDKTDIIYFLSECLEYQTEQAQEKFHAAFALIRESSWDKAEGKSIDNP